jgi:hypothetical protein
MVLNNTCMTRIPVIQSDGSERNGSQKINSGGTMNEALLESQEKREVDMGTFLPCQLAGRFQQMVRLEVSTTPSR